MGRNAHPIQILQSDGKKHLTKTEIEARKKAQIKLGDKNIECPEYVLSNPVALEKWKEVAVLYSSADFVSSGDAGLIARYCITHAEYLALLKRFDRIEDIHNDDEELTEYVETDDNFNYKIRRRLLDIVSTDGLLRIETAINKKMDMLIKMEDRLFLNPLAKVKNVPKSPEKPKTDPNAGMFGDTG